MLSPVARESITNGTIEEAAEVIRSGGVVAYPTESCFGLGCDPRNNRAVERILKMKKRLRNKGVILIADRFERFTPYVEDLPDDVLQKMMDSWPGPNTWLCPSKSSVSAWLRGDHSRLAIRVTAHRPAAQLARIAKSAIVSTSANIASCPSLITARSVVKTFGGLLDMVVDQSVGSDRKPSAIRDALTGEVIR